MVRKGGDGVATDRGKPDIFIFAAVILLLAIGLVVLASASSVTGLIEHDDAFWFLKRQLIFATLGVTAMVIMMRVDYRFMRLVTPLLLISAFVLLVLVLVVGQEIGGARRWLDFGLFKLQPSEVAKLALVTYLASYITTKRERIGRLYPDLLVPLVVIGIMSGLILLEPDFGTTVVVALTGIVVLFAGGAQGAHLGLVAAVSAPVAYVLIRSEEYRVRRLTAFLNPWADKMDSGWNIIQSLLAIGSGGLFGLGLGEGRQKYLYLPEQHTDFIFAILGEELGFVGTTVVLLLFAVIAWRGWLAALRAPDMYGCMLAVGITTMIVFQALLNIGVVTGSLPTTGITLPFVSFGGSSLGITLASMGILLNISSRETGVQ